MHVNHQILEWWKGMMSVCGLMGNPQHTTYSYNRLYLLLPILLPMLPQDSKRQSPNDTVIKKCHHLSGPPPCHHTYSPWWPFIGHHVLSNVNNERYFEKDFLSEWKHGTPAQDESLWCYQKIMIQPTLADGLQRMMLIVKPWASKQQSCSSRLWWLEHVTICHSVTVLQRWAMISPQGARGPQELCLITEKERMWQWVSDEGAWWRDWKASGLYPSSFLKKVFSCTQQERLKELEMEFDQHITLQVSDCDSDSTDSCCCLPLSHGSQATWRRSLQVGVMGKCLEDAAWGILSAGALSL